MVENYYSAIDFVNWFAEISTPSWAILGLTSQSIFGRCCTTGHLGSTERSSSYNAGGWEGPRICCWWFLLGTKCLWSHVWRQREKPHKKVSCVLEVSLCLTASGIGFSSALTHVRTRFRPLESVSYQNEHCPFLLRILWVFNFQKHLSSCIYMDYWRLNAREDEAFSDDWCKRIQKAEIQ